MNRPTWASQILVAACSVIATSGCALPQMAARVDAGSIRAIKVGMTEREVRAILGAPLRVRPWGKDAEIYDYAIAGWGLWSPQLWISFDHGRVPRVLRPIRAAALIVVVTVLSGACSTQGNVPEGVTDQEPSTKDQGLVQALRFNVLRAFASCSQPD